MEVENHTIAFSSLREGGKRGKEGRREGGRGEGGMNYGASRLTKASYMPHATCAWMVWNRGRCSTSF